MRLKAFFTGFFMVVLCTFLMAQTQPTTNAKRERTDMFMVSYNYETLLNFPDSIRLSPWSRGVGISLMYDHFLAESDRISVGIGFGFYSHNYYTKADIVTSIDTAGNNFAEFVPFGPGNNIRRHKITRNYFEFPFEIRYRTKPNEKGNSWKVAAGAKLGYRTNIYSKTITNSGDKYKSFIYPQMSRSRYGVTGRIGYGKVSVNGYYSLSNLFFEGRGTELTPLSLGVTITLF